MSDRLEYMADKIWRSGTEAHRIEREASPEHEDKVKRLKMAIMSQKLNKPAKSPITPSRREAAEEYIGQKTMLEYSKPEQLEMLKSLESGIESSKEKMRQVEQSDKMQEIFRRLKLSRAKQQAV